MTDPRWQVVAQAGKEMIAAYLRVGGLDQIIMPLASKQSVALRDLRAAWEELEAERDRAHVLRDATVAQYRDRAGAAEKRVAELQALQEQTQEHLAAATERNCDLHERVAELEAALSRIAQMKDYGAAVEAVQALGEGLLP